MRVMILAGGEGTRLRPLTDHMPKVMVSIHGRPFIHYLLEIYKKHDIVLSVNYKKESIRNWCRETKNYLEFVEEPCFLGTGGAIRISEPFMYGKRKFAVVNGDTYIEDDLTLLAKEHSYKKDVVTIVYARDMLTNELRNSGVYFFSKSIFNYIRKTPKYFIMEDMLKEIPHRIIESDKKFLDIGTFEGLKYSKEHLFFDDRWQREKKNNKK